MTTLLFQKAQLQKELCVIELKLKSLDKGSKSDLTLLTQLQDARTRHRNLLNMIEQHLSSTKVSYKGVS